MACGGRSGADRNCKLHAETDAGLHLRQMGSNEFTIGGRNVSESREKLDHLLEKIQQIQVLDMTESATAGVRRRGCL